MRLLLTGGTGQVGWELTRSLAPLGEVVAPKRSELDLSDPEALRSTVRYTDPDVIVNAAAYTDVDQAEENHRPAEELNVRAPRILAEEAARARAAMVHFSTDYVFDGKKEGPYREGDLPSPLNVYGRTKLAGEEAIRSATPHHLILRTSWVYGLRRENFVTTMLALFEKNELVSAVDDQLGSPTWCRYLADSVAHVLCRHLSPGAESPLSDNTGTFHLAGGGSTTWYGLARAILRKLRQLHLCDGRLRIRELEPVSTSEFPRPATRPRNSALACDAAREELRLNVVPWERQLSFCLEGLAD